MSDDIVNIISKQFNNAFLIVVVNFTELSKIRTKDWILFINKILAVAG